MTWLWSHTKQDDTELQGHIFAWNIVGCNNIYNTSYEAIITQTLSIDENWNQLKIFDFCLDGCVCVYVGEREGVYVGGSGLCE